MTNDCMIDRIVISRHQEPHTVLKLQYIVLFEYFVILRLPLYQSWAHLKLKWLVH